MKISDLSDDQMGAAMHGLGKQKSWMPYEFPQGDLKEWIAELPSWLLDVHVDMNRGCANSPSIRLKVDGQPWPKGEEPMYEFEEPDFWRARSSDGWSLQQHIHGRAFKTIAWRMTGLQNNQYTRNGCTEWRIENPKYGETALQACMTAANNHLELCKTLRDPPEDPKIEYKECWATRKDAGYGGRVFWIKTKDGREVALRGPFHSGSPLGWMDVTFYARDDSNFKELRDDKEGRPWYKRMGFFGYYVSEELIKRVIAKHLPHLRLAIVYPGYGHARLEPYEQSWGCPKQWLTGDARQPGE